MKIELAAGKYVVAVSGGVDSVVLLDILAKQSDSTSNSTIVNQSYSQQPKKTIRLSDYKTMGLVVAHFDHGIREDSGKDREFVQKLAEQYGLQFEYGEGRLGAGASEAAARTARYEFLRRVQEETGAQAIVTAHHQDDVLETAVINLLRGTGRRGLSSLKTTGTVNRPMLHVPKKEIIAHARAEQLTWREDSTNQNTRYLRNHIRHNIMPHFTASQRQQLLSEIALLGSLNQQIDQAINELIPHFVREQLSHIERKTFIGLPHAVAREVMAAWLRGQGIKDYDTKTLERLVVVAKTYRVGKRADVNGRYSLEVGKSHLALVAVDR
jgi:tRNA(Ile)-lysidine synthase